MEAKRKQVIYKEEFRRQAVEMIIHSGKTQAQVARELGCSEYSLNFWKKAYLRQPAPVLNHPFLNKVSTRLLHRV
jgi:transposase-like protein